MKTKTRFIRLSDIKEEAISLERYIRNCLKIQPESEDECLDETISFTADFGDGIQMDVKLCPVDYEEGGDNRPWTEAVLFRNGSELTCTDPDVEFFTVWEIEYENVIYRTIILVPETRTGTFLSTVLDMYKKGDVSDEKIKELYDGYTEAFEVMINSAQHVNRTRESQMRDVMGLLPEAYAKWRYRWDVLKQIIYEIRRDNGLIPKAANHGLNTCIDFNLLGYRGAKKKRRVVLHGLMTEEQKNILIECCNELQFIPPMVGLECDTYVDFKSNDPCGVWAELQINETKEPYDKDITPGVLVAKFQDAKRRNWAFMNPDTCMFLPDYAERSKELPYSRKEKWRGFSARQIYELWLAFGDVPMDPETECIESEWNGFPAGTFREDIWHWFEDEFGISVAVNLMGQ